LPLRVSVVKAVVAAPIAIDIAAGPDIAARIPIALFMARSTTCSVRHATSALTAGKFLSYSG
jgi:hypothetical protein